MGFGGMIRASAVLSRWHVYECMCGCDIRRIVGVLRSLTRGSRLESAIRAQFGGFRVPPVGRGGANQGTCGRGMAQNM